MALDAALDLLTLPCKYKAGEASWIKANEMIGRKLNVSVTAILGIRPDWQSQTGFELVEVYIPDLTAGGDNTMGIHRHETSGLESMVAKTLHITPVGSEFRDMSPEVYRRRGINANGVYGGDLLSGQDRTAFGQVFHIVLPEMSCFNPLFQKAMGNFKSITYDVECCTTKNEIHYVIPNFDTVSVIHPGQVKHTEPVIRYIPGAALIQLTRPRNNARGYLISNMQPAAPVGHLLDLVGKIDSDVGILGSDGNLTSSYGGVAPTNPTTNVVGLSGITVNSTYRGQDQKTATGKYEHQISSIVNCQVLNAVTAHNYRTRKGTIPYRGNPAPIDGRDEYDSYVSPPTVHEKLMSELTNGSN